MFVKAQPITGFPFSLVNKFTGSPVTTGSVTGYYTLDGGVQHSLSGTFTHEGNGQWSIDTITATETDGDLLGLLFLHDDALPVSFTIKLSAEPYGEVVTGTPSETAICNLALARLGQPAITSMADGTPNADSCNLMFEPCRDRVLDEVCPNFAVDRVALARLADPPTYGFAYAYQIPANVLRILDEEETAKTWVREGDTILSDLTALNVRILKRERDTTKWTPLFTDAMVASLAAELAAPVTKTAAIIAAMEARAERAIAKAQTAEGAEKISTAIPSTRLTDARYVS